MPRSFSKTKMAVINYIPIFNRRLANSSLIYKGIRNVHVVMTDDSSVVVCWHPETHFPYEKSLPVEKIVTKSSDSILKVQSNKELLSVLKPKPEEIVRQELMAMTHTVKHIWFPPKFQFRKKEKTRQRDRPYL